MSYFKSVALCVVMGVLMASLQGCGGGGGGGGTPAPGPAPPPAVPVAPNPADMEFTIPDHMAFSCVQKKEKPAGRFAQGFFAYRWTTKKEATSEKVNSDTFGDINPYFLLTELMTNIGLTPLASKAGGCSISKCGENPADGGCVLERVYLEMNNGEAPNVLQNAGIWGKYLSIDNGIPSQYGYWAFNYTGRNPTHCQDDTLSADCNYYFNGGYPVGCQQFSTIVDQPVWYSTVAACPKYPFDKTARIPQKVTNDFVWHNKLDTTDPDVEQCNAEMPGGNYCGGRDKKGKPKGSPWKTPSKTCTWQSHRAGYLTVENIFNVPKGLDYKKWCMEPSNQATNYTDGTGIPSGISLFYNLSEAAFPVLKGVTPQLWHSAVSADQGQLTPQQKAVFQNWAKFAKVRLNEMFTEMDVQAFKEFNAKNVTDPEGHHYKDCVSNADVVTPPCQSGVVARETLTHLTV